MAPREVSSVTPILYAFKRGFTFSGRTSAEPDILNLLQSYELFSKLAIGISLQKNRDFPICITLCSKRLPKIDFVIHFKNKNDIGVKYPQGARAPTCNMSAARLLPRSARDILCIYTIGISLLINRDFPLAYVNTFLYLCSRKSKRYNCLTL